MLKQTILWTALPHGSDGPLTAGAKLHLSVFVSPRLWSDDPTAGKLKLSDFPDFLDWPAKIGAAAFTVAFDGGPSLPATVVATKPLRSDLWQALFKNDTLVLPYQFENLTGADILSFPALDIHDAVKDIYQRVAADPAYGVNLPPRGALAADPGLTGIARPVQPRRPYKPIPVDDKPAFVGDREPEPIGDVGTPDDGGAGEPEGCGCAGCLAMPIVLLRRLLKALGLVATFPLTFAMGGPIAWGAGRPTGFAFKPDGGAGSGAPLAANKTAFDQLQAYVKPTSAVSAALPGEPELADTYDFHRMVAAAGDYPNLLRYLGLVVDLEVTLPAALPAAAGTVKVTPTLPLTLATTHYTPRTHYELGDGRFLARPGSGGDLRDGLLRLDDTNRFRVIQLDVAGSGIKLQSTATTLVNQEQHDDWAGNEPQEQGLPYLQTAGLSVIRPGAGARLKERFFRAYALNKALALVDNSPTTPAAGAEPPPSDELWAEDIMRGYRVDVYDDQSKAWRSLCRRVGEYKFSDAPGGPITLSAEEDEGFVQASATEPMEPEGTRVLRAHESLFTWSGWSLAAPRYGKTILPDHTIGEAPNEAATPFKMEATFRPAPKSLPRLRYGYSYRLRARAVDLAGNSVFTPNDPAFAVTQPEVAPEVRFRRFEPVSPPAMMLRTKPVEGESLERLVVRSPFDDATNITPTERHIVPPKTSQLMAEQHRKFDGAPGMASDPAAYQLAGREAGSLTHAVDPNTGDPVPIPGATEVVEGDHTYWLQVNDTFDLSYLPDPYARGVLLMGLPGMAAADQIVEPNGQIVNKIPFQGDWPDPKPFRLRVTGVVAGATPTPPVWDATDRVLTVQLPQGETYHVRISSYLHPADLDNMAVWGWVAETSVPHLAELRKQAEAGRNWLHLPFRELVLVHAVQQPLAIPRLTALAAHKQLNDTLATLSGRFRVDAKSTQKVDLRASWRDPFDDPEKPTYDEATDFVAQEMHVAEVNVTDPEQNQVDFSAIQHPLGDTRYHSVTYTPIASTRFREYFSAAVTADPQNLIRPTAAEVGTPPANAAKMSIKILNSARPAAAKPLYLLPTFAWTRSSSGGLYNTLRRGGGLRVYMERPWFSSGEGELLGVLLRPPTVAIGSDAAERLKKYTSEWGMDPLWPAASTAPLAMSSFVAPAAVSSKSVFLAEMDDKVDVVGYRPQFDEERNLWYCDILLDPDVAYFPMVRLALARFQPNSIARAEISAVTLADFIQVAPHRAVSYDATKVDVDGTLKVEVVGPTYFFPQLETWGVSQMIVRLERRTVAGADDELGWTPIAAYRMHPQAPAAGKVTWELTFQVPQPRPNPLRVVVLEVERYQTDGRGEVDVLRALEGADLPGLGGQPAAMMANVPLGYRITFADAIELP